MRFSVVGIYFRGFKSWNCLLGFVFMDGRILIIPRGLFFCDSKMCNVEVLWKNKFWQYLNKSFTEDILTV